jgi:MYXO-CTERM domain-containing protein
VIQQTQAATPLPAELGREGHIASAQRSRLTQFVSVARREATLFQIGVGVVAIHVVDDSFLQPQPGTSAGDHLVSGLVPLAILLGFAGLYERLRGGLRATIALTFGLFGIVAGIEAGYYTAKVGPSGDDYTGLLAIPAGLLLLGVGAATLWRTRRRDDGLRRRYLRRFLLAVGVFVGTYMLVMPFFLGYVLTHTARAVVPPARLGAPYREVAFTTGDGLRLKGWYVPSRNRAAVIAFPGRAGSQRQTRMLARHGYGVLLFDRRGEGESQGDSNAFGWAGAEDMKAALAFLQRRPDLDRDRIGAIGLSVGGEMLLEAAAESHGLAAVVSEGAGERSIREYLDMTGGRKWGDIPTSAALTAGTALFSNHMPPPSLKDLVGRISPTPVFFIYGEHGQDGERNLNPTYYKAAGKPKTIWEVSGSGHVGGITAQPREYERRVVGFFDRALLNGQAD